VSIVVYTLDRMHSISVKIRQRMTQTSEMLRNVMQAKQVVNILEL